MVADHVTRRVFRHVALAVHIYAGGRTLALARACVRFNCWLSQVCKQGWPSQAKHDGHRQAGPHVHVHTH